MTKLLILLITIWLAAVPIAHAQGGPWTYQVRRGDTWTSVARRLRVPMCRLAAANGHPRCSSIYRASSRLIPGQTLTVPYQP